VELLKPLRKGVKSRVSGLLSTRHLPYLNLQLPFRLLQCRDTSILPIQLLHHLCMERRRLTV
jgi:hypothetical protein